MRSHKVKKPADQRAAPQQAEPAEPGSAGPAPAELRYDIAFEFALDCQLLTDSQGLILNVNHAGTKFLQLDKSFLLGKPMGLLFTSTAPNPFYDYLGRIALGMVSCSYEARLLGPRKRTRDVLVMGVVHTPNTIRWVVHDTTPWKEAEAARVELLRKLITVQEDERRQLARDLHDNVGQLLTALSLALGTFEEAASLSPQHQRAFTLAQRVVGELRTAIHDIARGLRSGLVREVGLHMALEQLVSEWAGQEPNVTIELDAETIAETQLPREVESIVYSLIQEALTNAYQHADARHICVGVKRERTALTVIVQDDGIGFDAQLAAHQSGLGRLGLVGMRERASLVGGILNIDTTPGAGTKVLARIPIPASAEIPRNSHE